MIYKKMSITLKLTSVMLIFSLELCHANDDYNGFLGLQRTQFSNQSFL